MQSLYIIFDEDKDHSNNGLMKVYQPYKGQNDKILFKEKHDAKFINNLVMEPFTQPFFLDINGDMITDILYLKPSTDGGPPKIGLLEGHKSSSDVTEYKESDPLSFIIPEGEGRNKNCLKPDPEGYFSSPHSNSFIDLNGDCLPDIFLQKQKAVTSTFGKTTY